MNNMKQESGLYIDWTNDTGVAVTSGQPLMIGDLPAVAVVDIAINGTGSVLCSPSPVVKLTAVLSAAKVLGTKVYSDLTSAGATLIIRGTTAGTSVKLYGYGLQTATGAATIANFPVKLI